MEKRAVLAAVLMAAVLMLYQIFFVSAPPPEAPRPVDQQPAPAEGVKPPASPPVQVAKPTPAPVEVKPRRTVEPKPPQRLTQVQTPLYETLVSSEGGKFQEFTLKYRGEKPLVVVGELGPAGLLVGPERRAEPVSMRVSSETLTLSPEQPTRSLSLEGDQDGLRVRESLTFTAATYSIDVAFRVENASNAPRAFVVALPWSTRQAWHETKEKFQGQHPTEIVWSVEGVVHRAENLCQVPALSRSGDWIAVGSNYYMAAFIPRTGDFTLVASGENAKICEAKTAEPVGRATIAAQASPTLAPGQAWEGRVTLFVGPKEYDRLQAHGLEAAVNFGCFPWYCRWGGIPMRWFGVPILLLMNWVYDHVGNYGIAIILLTVVSKVLFFPLTVKSMRSMKAMQALQPQVNALRNKYKSDPQRLQRETLELYRKHRVNPMGGCLPMVAQIPIFYALYLALSVSVELQNAAFLCFGRLFGVDLWICDLASQDPTYVLPVLMGVTMFVQQKMTPVAGDPRQAKMMLVMPFIFTFMFLNLPSGLVLYWTVSNILQILQQYYMDRPKAARAAREAKDAGRA